MQQDPPHCEAEAVAAAVAEQGADVGQPYTIRRPCRTRSGVRRQQLQEVRGAGDVPEPPSLQEAARPGRGRVRLHQPGPTFDPLRRVRLRRDSTVHFPVRVRPLVPVRQPRRFPEVLPRGCQEES
ncbi:hypothetical protein ACOSP7_011102 [Xanthoceras sorbifolium]